MIPMSADLFALPAPPHPSPVANSLVEITTFSYEDRRVIFPAVTEALELCGCWLLQRNSTSLTQVEFHFEVHLRSVVDLYAALIAAGLELTRASHNDLTALCTLRQHRDSPSNMAGLVTARLEISFLEDAESMTLMASTAACA
jgi:hypothetical protein